MSGQLIVVLVLLGFPAPFVLLLQRHASDRTLEGLFDRVSLGYAFAFVSLFAAAQLRLWLFVPIWAVAALVCLVDLVRHRSPRPQLIVGSEGMVVLGTAVLYLGLRCLPLIVRALPIGWDAYFHMTISEQIVMRGRAVHDWMPYEDMPLNYPIGAHLLMALTQWLSGLRPHRFFELIEVLFTLLSGLQLFSLTTRASGDRRVGCYAALAYLFLANLGSLQYVMWSGMPNLVGMYLFLGLLSALTVEGESRLRSTAIFACYFLAACFVHHHVMVTAGLCLLWTAGYLWFAGDRARSKRIALGLVASGVIGTPYFLMYLTRTVGLGNTRIAGYLEPAEDAWGMAQFIGLGYSLAVLVGVYLYFKHRERVSSLLIQPLVALLVLYIADEFVLRTLSHTLYDHEIAPFTSSRFITDAVALLAVFAGIFFRTMEGTHEANRRALVGLILAGFFFFNRGSYQDTFDLELGPKRIATYEWIRAHAAPEVQLLDGDLHATYFTRLMSSSFPLPTSEYSSLAENKHMLEALQRGKKRAKHPSGPIWAVVEARAPTPEGKLLWRHGGLRVVEVFAPKP